MGETTFSSLPEREDRHFRINENAANYLTPERRTAIRHVERYRYPWFRVRQKIVLGRASKRVGEEPSQTENLSHVSRDHRPSAGWRTVRFASETEKIFQILTSSMTLKSKTATETVTSAK